MYRVAFPMMCVTLLAAPLVAQDQPTAADQKALAGAWSIDPARSDTINAATLRGLRPSGGFAGGGAGASAAGSSSGGGGGGKGGRSGNRAPAAPATNDAAGTDSADARRDSAYTAYALRDPHLALVVTDMNPGATLTIATNDSAVTLADAKGRTSSFRTDGRKREEAQMDGSIIETQALWKDGTLEITRGVAGTATLKREFKPGKDGQTLEVKETIEAGSGKVQKKLVFTRKPG